MKTVTTGAIRALIEAQIEPAEPQTSLVDYLGSHAGERLTIRHVKELQRLIRDDSLRLRKQCGMTHINWGYDSEKNTGSLLIGWQEKGITIPNREILVERNSCYFAGAQARNACRKKVLEDNFLLEQLAQCIAQYNAAFMMIYKRLLDYGKPFYADQYAIRQAFIEGEDKE